MKLGLVTYNLANDWDVDTIIEKCSDTGFEGVELRPTHAHGVEISLSKAERHEVQRKFARECAEFASNMGGDIRMEVHGQETCELPNMKTIMDVGDHPNLKVCWNCNNGETVDDSIQQNFDLVKDRIGLVHIHDIGVPDYPYQELITILKEINYEGFCLAEISQSPAPDRLMR